MAQGSDGKIFYMCDSENEECDPQSGSAKQSPGTDMDEDFKMKPSSSLQLILASISQARSRECPFVSHGTAPFRFVLFISEYCDSQLSLLHYCLLTSDRPETVSLGLSHGVD